MNKFLLCAALVTAAVTGFAQQKPAVLSNELRTRSVPAPVAVDGQTILNQTGNVLVHSKATLDDIIGSTRYDMQTNGSIMNDRLHLWADGSLSATWTMAFTDPSYGDRGTGYNYSDGTTWNEAPTTRLETMKSGWPSIHPWGANGELVMAHNSTSHLVMQTRPQKGTGTWTQNNNSLTAPAGVSILVWPRTCVNGPNNQYIHVLVMTAPVANGGTKYQGLDGALIYYRSLNGGQTWDKQGIILPGLTSENYFGFGGDDYAWAEPHGDTLVFVNGGQWTDTFIMKSVDNGNTWTKTQILPNYYSLNNGTTQTPAFICCDGSVAAAIDKGGIVHVAFGRMRAICTGSAHNYYPGTDGLVYWNSTMPTMDTALVSDIDALINADRCIGFVVANGTDSIIDFPYYGVSLSSFPQIVVDDYNNKYFFWSSLTVGNPSPDPYNYRHIWARAWFHNKSQWTELKDLNDGVLYMFQEFTYPAVASDMKNNKVQMITQTSDQPGSNIKDTTIPIHDVNIEYREIPVSTFFPVGIENQPAAEKNPVGKNYPNPVKSTTSFNLSLDQASNVSIILSNVMGQKIQNLDKGMMNAGGHRITLDASDLASGIYFYTVKFNGTSYTHKMIVE